ncbi:hypothetical protein CPB84DRAFT_1777343 [Gymnopilus junonius]|uniref:Uncharacterized protein n=1 Tax=Gymnopilus junonius TaxID=109634 RepID=A0A9P5NP02_GYMJU|nr:hypothetical protein CPB84DRAFT_1777343 [Gymnopilus junonius]
MVLIAPGSDMTAPTCTMPLYPKVVAISTPLPLSVRISMHCASIPAVNTVAEPAGPHAATPDSTITIPGVGVTVCTIVFPMTLPAL